MEIPVISANLATNDKLAAQPLINWPFCPDNAILDCFFGQFCPMLVISDLMAPPRLDCMPEPMTKQ
jgi:hypothetical protein